MRRISDSLPEIQTQITDEYIAIHARRPAHTLLHYFTFIFTTQNLSLRSRVLQSRIIFHALVYEEEPFHWSFDGLIQVISIFATLEDE